MKTMISFLCICFIGALVLQSCSKETEIYVPISFTDKDGSVFIPIDTITKNIDAYSSTRISQGILKGIFNDTIRASFYLAIISDPYWDTVYHQRDTIVFPTHFQSHIITLETHIDLKNYTSPYHFLLMDMPQDVLKKGPHGTPSIKFTIDTRTN